MYKKLYLKITTVPNQLEVDINSKEIEIFKNKYQSHKSFLKDSDVELAYLNESAINGSFAKIYSITLGFVHEGFTIVKTIKGEEKDLLNKLLSILRQEEFKDTTLVMYNRIFILSFLSKRFRKYNFSIQNLPVSLDMYDKKPWTIKGSKCIQEYIKGISYQTENFSETCFIHGIDNETIEGSDIVRYIKKEQYEEVHESDISYIHSLMQVDSQLSGESLPENLDTYVEEIGKVEPQEVNVLDHILTSGNLTTPIIKKIVEFTEENNLNREDVLTLVKTALSKNKPYQKVEEEGYEELKDALGLSVDYSKIQVVVDKGNMGAKECKALIKEYENKTKKEKEDTVNLVVQFLTENNKINQKRTRESLKLLKSSLLN